MQYHAYLFVDGSSSRNQDIGAWAAVACVGDRRQLLYGIDYPTTISRCELRPIIEGLRWIKANCAVGSGFSVCVYSDSEYTVRTLTGAYEPGSKNRELWMAVAEVQRGLNVTFKWRERNSLPYMSFCDGVCGALRKAQIQYMSGVAKDPRKPEESMPYYEINTDEDSAEAQDSPV